MSTDYEYGLTRETKEKLITVVKRHTAVERVVIYGSRAKGNFKPGSDIDLTIFTSETDLSFLFKIENEIDDLLLPYTVDLSLFATLDNENLKEHIVRVGKIFYERG